jgi:phosphoheptose isomerase
MPESKFVALHDTPDIYGYIEAYKDRTYVALNSIPREPVANAIRVIEDLRLCGWVFTCGNGGSHSIASHLAEDLLKCSKADKGPRAFCLGDAAPTVMAIANDISYDEIFAYQMERIDPADGCLVAFSGSGNSKNIIRAAEKAKELELVSIGVTTICGGKLKDLVDIPICIASANMAALEDAFQVVAHMIAYSFIEDAP